MRGLEHFTNYFSKFKDQYVIIGGTATYINLLKAGVKPRVTKDLDIVLIIEALSTAFVEEFWKYVEVGAYEHRKANTKNQFYRFDKPLDATYPYMIEILSRKPDVFKDVDTVGQISRLTIEEEVISLSAILLNDDYYYLILENLVIVDDMSIVTEVCLIPLKAKAYLDLSSRKELGEKVKSGDIKKHKNDIFRLIEVIDEDSRLEVNDVIKYDLKKFIEIMTNNPTDLKSLGLVGDMKEYLSLITLVYSL